MRSAIWLLAAAMVLAATQANSGSRVGVVELEKIFEAHPGKPELEKELSQLTEELETSMARIRATIATKREELQARAKGTSIHAQLEKEIFALQTEMRYEQRRVAERFEERKRAFHSALLEEIETTIADVAMVRGYDAVLQKELSVSENGLSWKSVLFHRPAIDLTDAVLAALGEKK